MAEGVGTIENLANPVINAPYEPPRQHFELGPDGTPTGTLVPGRRPSQSFIPVPVGKKGKANQVALDFDIAGERIEANSLINDIRREVELWRARNYPGATAISRKLMLHWASPTRENRVLFCHCCVTGGSDPYARLEHALKSDIGQEAWESLYSTLSRPFPKPETGNIAVKVINDYGDGVLQVLKGM